MKDHQQLNIWISLWTNPRATTQQFITYTKKQQNQVFFTALFVSWILSAILIEAEAAYSTSEIVINITKLIAFDMVLFYINSYLFYWVISAIGGSPSIQNTMSVIKLSHLIGLTDLVIFDSLKSFYSLISKWVPAGITDIVYYTMSFTHGLFIILASIIFLKISSEALMISIYKALAGIVILWIPLTFIYIYVGFQIF